MKQFSELPLTALLQSNLAKLGFTEPTPVQAQALEPALAGHDLIATAQTGTGKTLAFVLPLVQMLSEPSPKNGVRALVLVPTRELAIQIDETLAKIAVGSRLRSAIVVGGLSERPQLQAIRRGVQVIVATPGRLCDYLKRRLVNLSSVGILILDEADRMLDMGFLPAIKTIVAELPKERQTLCFSATMEPSVKHLVQTYVKDPVQITVGSVTKPCEQVDLHCYVVEQDRKLGLLRLMLEKEQGTFLVFARTKHGAEKLAKKLAVDGVKATAIHGDRSQSQRNSALRGFQNGEYRVLVATDVAARGIHVEGISHVVNYDLPQVPGDFIHRVGRTGRAGARGTASTFAMPSERGEITRIERTLGVRLTRRDVAPGIAREEKSKAAVIVMPRTAAAHTGHNAHTAYAPHQERRGNRFGAKPKTGGRPSRRAV